MGVKPEDIERRLQGRKTLPEPGEPMELAGGELEAQPGERGAPGGQQGGRSGEPQRGSGGPTPGERDLGEGIEGPRGQMLDADEEQRFQRRGGRFNAAKEGEERA